MDQKHEKLLEDIGRGFEEFKSKNDQRLTVLEKRQADDVVLREQIDRIGKAVQDATDLKSRLEKAEAMVARLTAGKPEPLPGLGGRKLTEQKMAFGQFINGGDPAVLKPYLTTKAMTIATSSSGGHLVPEEIAAELEKFELEISDVRSLVSVRRASSSDWKKNVNTRGRAAGWVGETDTRSLTATSTYEQVAPTFGELMGYAELSRWLTEEAIPDVVNDFTADTADALAYEEGVAVVSGNGTSKPTGFLTGTPVTTADSSRAFGVLQYVASGAAGAFAASNPADPLITLTQAMKAIHRKNGRFAMNKNTVAGCMKLKDGQGNYLYGVATAGMPATILGYPISELEAMPDIAANSFSIAFGDFKRGYQLVDVGSYATVRDEVTLPGFIRFYTYRRVGGKVINSQAIKLLKFAAS